MAKDKQKVEAVFKKMLEESRALGATLLLSSEGFYIRSAELYPLLAGLRVVVIAWFRDPVDTLISNYNQSVKRNAATESLLERCQSATRSRKGMPFDGKSLHDWADLVGEDACFFLPYDGYSDENGAAIEDQWLEALKISKSLRSNFKFDRARINRSYTPAALELKRILNCVIKKEDSDENVMLDNFLQSYSDGFGMGDVNYYSTLDAQVANDLVVHFSVSKNKLIKRFPVLESAFKDRTAPDGYCPAHLEIELAELKSLWKQLSLKYPMIQSLVIQRLSPQLGVSEINASMLKLAEVIELRFVNTQVKLPQQNSHAS